jgi:Family of unknown function (DUF6152)
MKNQLPTVFSTFALLAISSRKVLLSMTVLFIAMPCVAHHSTAMFDDKKPVTLQGTVKLFQWTNPHCWIQVLVPSQGSLNEWSVEMGAPSQLYRKGWRPATLRPGDKVTVVIHPTKDGTKGGQFVSGIGPNGEAFEPDATARAQP